MRIISGSLKGKSINFLKNSTTRPLKDAVKENIFNILNHSNSVKVDINNSNVLDLYSGVGSFGLECLSRGVKKVTFVEVNNNSSNVLKKNLVQFSLINKAKVFNGKIENFLKIEKKEKYNILFFDPPFKDSSYIKNLHYIKENKMYESKHLIIIHRETKTEDKLDSYINTIFSKNYGRSKIIFGSFT